LHMQVTSELKSGLFLRGLWDWLPWIELESDEQTVTDHVLIIMLHHHHHPLGTTFFFCISQEERLQWTSTHQCTMQDRWMNDVWTKSTFSLYPCLVTYHGDKLCTNHPLSSTYHVTIKCMRIIYMHND
jgi:hypothetical protein